MPILTIVLLCEFLNKLSNQSNKFKHRCKLLAREVLIVGGKFVSEIKDEEELRFFVQQTDSRGRSALNIMSKNRYYELLESQEMSMIINEKWHGLNAQNFGLLPATSTYRILISGNDAEESRRLFKDIHAKTDMKNYVF